MSADIWWWHGDGGQDGVGPFGRDCGANYVNGVQWSVPLTALTLLLLTTQPNLGRFALLQFLALCPDSVFYFLCTSRRRPRPYWHSNILREFPANKYRRTSTSHSCPHYQHMRGRGNKWDIWQSEEHSNIATQTQTGWRRGGRGGRGVNRKIPYFPLNEFSNRVASTPANSLR